MQFFIGIAFVIATVFGGYLMAKGNIATFWQPAEYVIILGAAIGSMIIANSKSALKEMMHQIKIVLKGDDDHHEKSEQLMVLMYSILTAIKAGGGLKAIDADMENPEKSVLLKRFPLVFKDKYLLNFIVDNLRSLSMDKHLPHEFDTLMEEEVSAIEEDLSEPYRSMAKTGDAMPGFGILAAVGGIIITMQHLDGPLTEIGYHVAAALVGTFIGIFFAYGVMGPLASSMHNYVRGKITLLEVARSMIKGYTEEKSVLTCIDYGRRALEGHLKPTFLDMEKLVKAKDISKEIINKKAGG